MFAIFNGARVTQPLYRPTGIVRARKLRTKAGLSPATSSCCPDRIPQEARSQLLRAGWGGFQNGVRAALREWRRRRNGRLELARLDERMLRDIGLTRVDAEYEINKPFWRE
jgi:uncharacterized protein YjiS (DUF1127 family)